MTEENSTLCSVRVSIVNKILLDRVSEMWYLLQEQVQTRMLFTSSILFLPKASRIIKKGTSTWIKYGVKRSKWKIMAKQRDHCLYERKGPNILTITTEDPNNSFSGFFTFVRNNDSLHGQSIYAQTKKTRRSITISRGHRGRQGTNYSEFILWDITALYVTQVIKHLPLN